MFKEKNRNSRLSIRFKKQKLLDIIGIKANIKSNIKLTSLPCLLVCVTEIAL